MQGCVYHLIGSLLPVDPETPKFAQIYFMNDKEEQIETRKGSNKLLRSHLLEELQNIMEKHNSYTKSFRYAVGNMDCDDMKVIKSFFVIIN